MWAGWRQVLVIVTPTTVLRWQRRPFRDHWTKFSRRSPCAARRSTPKSVPWSREWPRPIPCAALPDSIGELLKLGLEVAERTVSRLLPKRRSSPSQTWSTFLTNHVRDLVAIDFFTVPTARLRVLFVLLVLAHHRRRVLHFNVTEHPSRSSRLSRMTPPRPICSAIAIASTITRSGTA
jgi:putative transposase